MTDGEIVVVVVVWSSSDATMFVRARSFQTYNSSLTAQYINVYATSVGGVNAILNVGDFTCVCALALSSRRR